ncbi:MAG TPA: orotidine-5'-phosphate decarboxylase [Burkholderiales bacterium]|nr:orotidine-5'-phosphate decarboxylase [Burkholderiales bacterium]
MNSRIIVALDYADARSATALVDRLNPAACKLKIGKELFTAAGPSFVAMIAQRGFEIFLDLKFHDIPNTVAQACKAAAQLGVWMINVHALGGRAMMNAAREGIESAAHKPKVIAVTVLTSMAETDLREVGIDSNPTAEVMRLAELASDCGLDGVVCSAWEASAIRDQLGSRFLRVTPGIRLPEEAADDQKRIMTPQLAIRSGSSYLVVGRSVTRSTDPLAVLARINGEISVPEVQQ